MTDFRTEKEKLKEELNRTLISGTAEESIKAVKALWLANPTKEMTIAAARMMATYYLALKDFKRVINVCMDTRDMLGVFDMHLCLCVKMANSAIARWYKDRTGKDLGAYNFEIVYTTEDEYDNEFDLSKDYQEKPEEGESAVSKQLYGNLLRNWEPYRKLVGDGKEKEHQKAFDAIYGMVSEDLKFNEGDRILDIGCGTMAIPLKLLNDQGVKDYELIGMDLRGHTLKAAKRFIDEHFPEANCRFIHGNAVTAIPTWFDKKEVDVVTTFDFIEHIRNEEYLTLIRYVHNILKDGGKFYISKPNGLRFIGEVKEKDATEHVSEKSVGYLLKTLHDAGFETKVLCRLRIFIEATKKEKA